VQLIIGRNLNAAEAGAGVGAAISDQPLPVEQFVQLFEVWIERDEVRLCRLRSSYRPQLFDSGSTGVSKQRCELPAGIDLWP
jgi:hypothetical protein